MIRYQKRIIILFLFLVLGIWYYLSLPSPLFNASYSTLLLDREGQLLGARIAADEQWRFPLNDSVPEKLRLALLHKEDRHFYYHPGFNPVALARALYLNLKHGEVRSGGSTITMQLVRLSKNNPPRTIWEKLKEIVLATRIELSYSKDEILAMYASHAPFGGNVVGYEAAAWRYYNRAPHQLSWAECATLAVLPNAPGMIHPGRNRAQLREKRKHLLQKLFTHEVIDGQTLLLAQIEEIPSQPLPLPNEAPHLLSLVQKQQPGNRVQTTIDRDWQQAALQTLDGNMKRLAANHIKNGALLLIDNRSGEVLSYVGNASYEEELAGAFNDMIQTPRSPGSILKPFLYASMLSSGELLPQELVKDIPVFLGGYKPENYERTHDGAVPAGEALARSLNIPAVLLLRDYSAERFLKRLHELDFRHMNKGAGHYGLSLILGGAEVTPWELGRAYYRLAASLNAYDVSGREEPALPDLHFAGKAPEANRPPVDKAAIYHTFNILTTVNRPDSEMGWQKFGRGDVAWKTGTSFGFRDAWAVGVTPHFTCVVWVGNASGEGRPGLIGAETAGPVLFDMMNRLPREGWFTEPLNTMVEVDICRQSGLKAGPVCPESERQMLPRAATRAGVCRYHQKIFVNQNGLRVTRGCVGDDSELMATSCFVLPPAQAWYFARQNAGYRGAPPWQEGCEAEEFPLLEIIYPQPGSEVFIPTDLAGDQSNMVAEVAYSRSGKPLYWHLNGRYLGTTEIFHRMPLSLEPGQYRLHVEDEHGQRVHRKFEVAYQNASRK